ncbi:MAG: hypothetical protein Kapaf2KO_13330 [Candidatus Kapaibacteriales bacterium]
MPSQSGCQKRFRLILTFSDILRHCYYIQYCQTLPIRFRLEKVKITYWQDGEWWLGYMNDYQEYETQGSSLEELKSNLADIYNDIEQGLIEGVRKSDFIEVA